MHRSALRSNRVKSQNLPLLWVRRLLDSFAWKCQVAKGKEKGFLWVFHSGQWYILMKASPMWLCLKTESWTCLSGLRQGNRGSGMPPPLNLCRESQLPTLRHPDLVLPLHGQQFLRRNHSQPPPKPIIIWTHKIFLKPPPESFQANSSRL